MSVGDPNSYIDSLQGSNNLPHATLEVPPGASASATSAMITLLLDADLEVPSPLTDEDWTELFTQSGEDELWFSLYACRAQLVTSAEEMKSRFGISDAQAVVRDQLTHNATTPNEAAELLAARQVSDCWGWEAESRSVRFAASDTTTIIRARLSSLGATSRLKTGDLTNAGDAQHAEGLLAEQGCTAWNQTLSWAVLQLASPSATDGIKRCARTTDLEIDDPEALLTSVELGMPMTQLRVILGHTDLQPWFSTDWQAGAGSVADGPGTPDNAVSVVKYSRLTDGAWTPEWLAAGVVAWQRELDPNAGLAERSQAAYLCVALDAECADAAMRAVPDVDDDLVAQVGRQDAGDGAISLLAAAQIQASQGAASMATCSPGRVSKLLDEGPQLLAQLAIANNECHDRIDESREEMRTRLLASLDEGEYERAAALMLLITLRYDPVDVSDFFRPAVEERFLQTMNAVSDNYGPDYLPQVKPLRLVIFASELEQW